MKQLIDFNRCKAFMKETVKETMLFCNISIIFEGQYLMSKLLKMSKNFFS